MMMMIVCKRYISWRGFTRGSWISGEVARVFPHTSPAPCSPSPSHSSE